MEIKNKFGGIKKLQDVVEERKSTTKQLGYDAKSRNNLRHFYLSEDIALSALKTKAKGAGLTINDLFCGAIHTAWSKLDLPEEKKPSQFNCFMAANLWSSDDLHALPFSPDNKTAGLCYI